MKYEELKAYIDKTLLFNPDVDKDSIEYRTEKKIVITYLFKYIVEILYPFKKDKNGYEAEPSPCLGYGVEIMNVANSCINNYNGEKASFLTYFSNSWEKEYMRLLGKKECEQEMRALSVPAGILKKVKTYKRLRDEIKADNEAEADEKIKIKMNVSDKEFMRIQRVCSIIFESHLLDDEDEDDDIFSRLDCDKNKIKDNLEVFDEQLESIEKLFNSRIASQKKVLAVMITQRICTEFANNSELIDRVKGYSFFSDDAYSFFVEHGRAITLKEAAALLSKHSSSLSRTYSDFVELYNKNK